MGEYRIVAHATRQAAAAALEAIGIQGRDTGPTIEAEVMTDADDALEAVLGGAVRATRATLLIVGTIAALSRTETVDGVFRFAIAVA